MARSLLPFMLCIFGSCHRERASSTVNQFPSLTPSFFAPFTRLIGESSDRCKPHIDGPRCKQLVFEMNPVTRHHHFVEGQSRLRAIPANEVINGTSVAALRFW